MRAHTQYGDDKPCKFELLSPILPKARVANNEEFSQHIH